MARMHTSRSFSIPHLYNVESPVGKGQANRPDDVALVQFFLNIAWQGRRQIPELADTEAPPDLAVDGIFGTLTEKQLILYQLKMDKDSPGFVPGLTADGIVHPVKTFALTSRGILMTMASLNQHFRQLRPQEFLQLGVAATLPPILAKSLLCVG